MPTSKSSIDHRDVYYRLGKSAGYRARSAYKLLHLDEEFDLFTGVETAVDLCAAPGSWSQVLGQKLNPSQNDNKGKKVVSIDLQPMARLPNITILQTDITLPSTIPLVLDALGGRRADLVVCDGAPDVTGVHDLDAYLHSQLLLAAITLSLTLLAPHSTLIFKIFLSPLDPQAALLASQLRCFFFGPSSTEAQYNEFDLPEEVSSDMLDKLEEQVNNVNKANIGKDGYDLHGRRGGVWVRKPRSSRKGSGEAFIVCRNFDPSRVPLPKSFSASALAELRQQTSGTLTLDSLASLGTNVGNGSKEWELIKGYVGGGDLNPIETFPTPSKPKASAPPISFQPPTSPSENHNEHDSTSPKALFAHPTPLDGPPEYFSPKNSPGPSSPIRKTIAPPTFLSPERLHLDTKRLAGPTARAAALAHGSSEVGESSSRQSSLDSLTPNPSPIHLNDMNRPWASSSHIPPSHAGLAQLSVPAPYGRDRSSSNASVFSTSSVKDDAPLISPALSSSSKTDLFFASTVKDSLPIPPRALPNAAKLGRGLPSGLTKNDERSTSMPTSRTTPKQNHIKEREQWTSAWAESRSIDLTSPSPSNQGYAYAGLPQRDDLKFGFEEFSTTSRLRSVSNPMAGLPESSTTSNYSPATSRFLKSNNMNEPLATLPTLPDVNQYTTPTKKRPILAGHGRRESQQLEREQSQAKEGIEVKSGDFVEPEEEGDQGEISGSDKQDVTGDSTQPKKRGWRLKRKLGEGAFSAVWSAIPISSYHSNMDSTEEGGNKVAALKLMDRQLSLQDSRTRISFLREVEVLRHISHPSIVSYLDSFTTPTHHVLVLEQLEGGELFDLMSVEENRKRMILPSPKSEDIKEWDRNGEGFVRRIFSELTRAVGWLHEVGVVHRDIKLENILFTMNPFDLKPTSTGSIPLNLLPKNSPLIKLTDFGLSRFISISSPLLQTRCGSESFAAPEIIMGKPYDGRETDSWAMGVVLYGMIIGELPFDREEDNEESIINGNGNTNNNRPSTPNLMMDPKLRGRKRMMRIAKGLYSYPDSQQQTISKEAKDLIGKLLTRDNKKRIKVNQLWNEKWMNENNPGGLPKPLQHNSLVSDENQNSSNNVDISVEPILPTSKSNSNNSRIRKILDGFLVEEDDIEEVARAEH
ncbi:uncharacterized protein L201_000707 [Kwoniella dendrophila CBS 6074]|uniref:Protein kinase domain-containing protein n=1 Tax=Kwoniella dendrophila CBS 6074 TaxID=1295534 RepID=A0AAX4JKD5_9TREE